MFLRFTILCLATVALVRNCSAEETREVYEQEIEASVTDIWEVLSTTEGLRAMLDNPDASVDFRLGGTWDRGAIVHTILSYDPNRMLCLQISKCPEAFRFRDAAMRSWSIYYLIPISETSTRIRVVGLGYDETEGAKTMRSYFQGTQADTVKRIAKAVGILAEKKQ